MSKVKYFEVVAKSGPRMAEIMSKTRVPTILPEVPIKKEISKC